MVKDVKIYFIGLKKELVLGVLDIEEIREKDNETGLKGGRKNSNVKLQVLSIYAMHALFRCIVLTCIVQTTG